MSIDNLDDLNLDPEVVSELQELPTEDPLVTEYGASGKDDTERSISFADKWFPNEDQWQGKTNISPAQARYLAVLRHFTEIFPEIDHLDSFLEGLVTNYEMYLTSIEGESREDHVKILTSIFGGPTETDEMTKSAILSAFAQNSGDNND